MSLKAIFSLLILTIILMVFSDSLIQDNREDLFLSKDYAHALDRDRKANPTYDVMVLKLSFNNEEQWQHLHSKLDELQFDDESFEWLSPRTLSGKMALVDQNDFFKDSQLLRLVNDKEAIFFFYISENNPKEREQLVSTVEQICKQLSLKPKWAGMPFLNVKLGEMSLNIKKIVMPMLFVVIAILLRWFLGSWQLSLYTFLPSLFGVSVSLAMTKFLWGYSTMVTTLVPILVFLVMLSLTLHLALAANYLNNVRQAWYEKRKAIFLALGTTILGLISLSISDIPAIKEFAITSSISLVISASVGLFFWQKVSLSNKTQARSFATFIKKFDISMNRYLALFILIVVALLGGWSMPKIPLQVEALYFFPQESLLVKNWRDVEHSLGGVPLVDIHLEGVFDNYDNLLKIQDIERTIKNNSNSEFKLVSPNEIVKEGNAVYSSENVLPDALISYQLLLSRIPKIFRPSMDSNQYTLSLIGKTLDTENYRTWIESIKLPENASFGGLYYWLMQSQDGLIWAMLESFLIGLFVVTIFVGLMVRSIKASFVFFAINLIPSLGTLLLYHILGKSLNVASITTFSISFGLIVDSTLHLMIHYRRHGLEHDQFVYETVFAPMLLVTIVMVCGFFLLCFYPFAPVADFGFAMAITLLFGFLLDFIFLPVLEGKKKAT